MKTEQQIEQDTLAGDIYWELVELNMWNQIDRIKNMNEDEKLKLFSPLCFKIYRLIFCEGYKTGQICGELSIKPAVVYRARQKLMKELGSTNFNNAAFIVGATHLV